MKAAYAMGIVAAGFAGVIGNGKENAKPGVVWGGDVDGGGFDFGNEEFNI